jgi:5-methylcytosine-specific restriction enzyme A
MDERVSLLLSSLGIDEKSFRDVLEWVLAERLVLEMAQVPNMESTIRRENGRRLFRDALRERTRRTWSNKDVGSLFDRVIAEKEHHERTPIPIEEAILLRLTRPLECVRCGRRPPDVMLHMDHILPASKGGGSTASNLQFLCAQCNLKKSNKREVGGPWLDLR